MSDLLQPTTFSYDTLDEVTREFVLLKANETHGLLKRTAHNVLAIGRNLQEVKEHLPHGQFLRWLQAEFTMSERHARNFMYVATRFGGKSEILADLSLTVIYELAAPSTSETVIEQVASKEIPPTVEAIKEAREAERRARDAEREAQAKVACTQQEVTSLREEAESQRATIVQLNHDIEQLQERLTALSSEAVQKQGQTQAKVPLEITAQLETLRRQIQELSQERDTLTQQVTQLGKEARAAALKREEDEQERRIRLNWFRATNAFQANVRALLAEWPSPPDTRAFDAQDWDRLAQVKEIARRFLKECDSLTGGPGNMIVESEAFSVNESGQAQDVSSCSSFSS